MIRGLLLALFAGVLLSYAADPRLVASVDRTTVRVGEPLTLTLSFDGSSSGVSNPALSDLGGLQRTGGPFTSTNMSIVNGRASSSITYTYRLKALKEGKVLIGPAKVNYLGKEFESQPITINVLAAGAASPATPGGGDAPGTSDNVFIRAIPDKNEVYVGEQVTVSYKIFFNVQMTNPEITQLPRAAGFWMEEISLPQQLYLTDEVINGKAYKSAVIRKLALFPTSTGDLEVEPMDVATKIQRQANRSRDPFDIFNDPFFRLGSQMEPVEVSSPKIKIRAKPLPDGAPPEFAGAVGNFKLSATLDRNQVGANDAVTFVVRIQGRGNIKTLPEPVIQFPQDFDRFDPKQSEDISRGAVINGTKSFEYVLIPRAPGEQRIPEIRYAYFDPETDKYQVIGAPPLTLLVGRGTGEGVAGSAPSVARRDVTSVGSDIAYLKKRPGSFYPRGKAPHQTVIFWTLASFPWLLAGSLLFVTARRRRAEAATPTLMGNIRRALKQLESADKHSQKNPADALRLVQSAVTMVLLPPGAAVTDMVDERLRRFWTEKRIEPIALDSLIRIQNECNLARFAVGNFDAGSARRLVQDARAAISQFGKVAEPAEQTA